MKIESLRFLKPNGEALKKRELNPATAGEEESEKLKTLGTHYAHSRIAHGKHIQKEFTERVKKVNHRQADAGL